MAATQIEANLLILDKRNTLVHEGRGWVVFGAFTASELLSAVDRFAADTLAVQFSAYDEKAAEQDKATYGRRLAKLEDKYAFSGFHPLVIDGFTFPNRFTGTLTRIVQ